MQRRTFVRLFAAHTAAAALPSSAQSTPAEKLVAAARAQIGVTTTYDPAYVRLGYPQGDVPRTTGVCADVIVRAARDGLGLDLQQLLHEDMKANFAAYPRIPGMRGPDVNIDQRRVLNLETYWKRNRAQLWSAGAARTAGDAFPKPLRKGDIVTWMIFGRLPHVAIVSVVAQTQTLVIHNIGRGAEEVDIAGFHAHPARGHFRWPSQVT